VRRGESFFAACKINLRRLKMIDEWQKFISEGALHKNYLIFDKQKYGPQNTDFCEKSISAWKNPSTL